MRRWYVHFRGQFYSNGPFNARSYRAALQWVREWLGVKRLPAGTEVYPAGR